VAVVAVAVAVTVVAAVLVRKVLDAAAGNRSCASADNIIGVRAMRVVVSVAVGTRLAETLLLPLLLLLKILHRMMLFFFCSKCFVLLV
jgi:hypothetical protein